MIRIAIKTGGAAFYDNGYCRAHLESARILRVLARRLENDERPERIDDLNGFPACTITYTGKDKP